MIVPTRNGSAVVRWIVRVLLLSATPIGFAADALGTADKTASEWVKLRIETTRAETEWRTEREMLKSLLHALTERATLLEEKRDLTRAKTAQDREEITALRNKVHASADDLKGCETRLNALSGRLLALRPKLPPRLSQALEMSYRSLVSPTLPTSERMQVTMNILNRCAQFNRQITVGDDVLTLDGARPETSFTVIYWGLSHAYAVDHDAHKAWLGSPGGDGWHWESKPDAYGAVVKLIAIANDKADPEFVAVPAVATRSVSPAPTK